MSAAPDLSFDALAPPGEEWPCLAYWIWPYDVAALRGVDAIGLSRAMSYQYDVEDQADRTAQCSPMPTGATSSPRSRPCS